MTETLRAGHAPRVQECPHLLSERMFLEDEERLRTGALLFGVRGHSSRTRSVPNTEGDTRRRTRSVPKTRSVLAHGSCFRVSRQDACTGEVAGEGTSHAFSAFDAQRTTVTL